MELQEYLLKFTSNYSVAFAKKRMAEYLGKRIKDFKQISEKEGYDGRKVPCEKMTEYLNYLLEGYPEEIV